MHAQLVSLCPPLTHTPLHTARIKIDMRVCDLFPWLCAVDAVTHMSQPAPSALTSPSNSNYRQPMHNSDNSTAATAGEENTAAHDPTGLPSSGHTVQDTSTTGTDIQQDMQLEAQRQQQQEQGQTHGKQQKPRPTHFVSLRVSHSPQVCCAAAAPAALCLTLG